MSTIDASGAIHGADGRFAGHVAGEADSSVTLTPTTDTQPDHDQYGPLRSNLDRAIAQQFASKTTAELKRKMERASSSTNLDDETHELSRRIEGQDKNWRWLRGQSMFEKPKIDIYTLGDPGKPYGVGAPAPHDTPFVDYGSVRSSVAAGESFGSSHARAVAARFRDDLWRKPMGDLADGHQVNSETLRHAIASAGAVAEDDDDRANLALLQMWADDQNPHPDVPQVR